mgnify:CR=1 FL=1
MTVNIGNQEFRSYTEAKRHAKNILNQHSIGRDVEPEEMCFLVDALRLRGKRGLEKIGCGVSRIYINHNQYGHRGFFIERIDGSHTDFSYIKCFTGHSKRGKITAAMKDVTQACRTAILKDKPKKGAGEVVHHEEIPFRDIVAGFLREIKKTPEEIEVVGHEDLSEGVRFKDQSLERQFRDYHQEHAVLEVLQVEEHKQRHSGKEVKS